MRCAMSTTWPMPSGPVRKPDMARPGRNARSASAGSQKASWRLPDGSRKHRPRPRRRSAAARDMASTRTPASVQPGGEPFQRVAVGDLPAIEDGAGAALVHQDALLAVVHAEGQGRGGGVGHLQPHDARAECAPFVEAGGFHPDIAQALQ